MPAINDKICLILPPKVGGQWARRVLRLKPATTHNGALPVTHVDAKQSEPWFEGREIGVVYRHPLPWLRSWYVSRLKENWGRIQGPSDVLRSMTKSTFSNFLDDVIKEGPVVDYIFDAYTPRVPHHTLQTEGLEAGVDALAKAAGANLKSTWRDVPPVNRSPVQQISGLGWSMAQADALFEANLGYYDVAGYAPLIAEAEVPA